MTSAKRPPPGPDGGPRSRPRPAPTIDLKATEIASEPITEPPAAAASAPEVAGAPGTGDTPPNAGRPATSPYASAEASSPPPTGDASSPAANEEIPLQPTAGEAGGSAPPADAAAPPPPEAPQPDFDAAQRAQATAQDGPPTGTSARSFPRSSIAWLPPDFPWTLIGAAAAGAVLMLILLAIGGLLTGRDAGTSAPDTRLANLEQQVRELAARPAPASVDAKSVDDLAARLGKVEAALASPRPQPLDPALANRMATLEGEARALGERIGVVARRTDDIATVANDARTRLDQTAAALAELQKAARPAAPAVTHSEVEALANRIAALERTAKALETELANRAPGASGDRAVRLAVTAALLKAAVERGEAFAAELAAAKALAADPRSLAPLEPFAATGVPTAVSLAHELSSLAPKLAQATGRPQQDGSFLERLQANAERLVRVRPIEEVPGDDPAAIAGRIEARAREADLAGALAELGKLPAPARAPAQAWIAKAQARGAAIEASRKFAADALAALGKPSP